MRVIVVAALAALASWAAWHGCSNGGVSREAGGNVDAPSGGGGGAGGRSAVEEAGCPAAVPVGGACPSPGRICTYGDAPRGECRARATCVDGRWATTHGDCAAPSSPSECPGLVPDATVACAETGQLCAYTGGVECVCMGGGAGWLCDVPKSPGGACPATPPNAGALCEGPASCTYPCGMLTRYAVFATCGPDRLWTWALMPCMNTNRMGRLTP
jgi:hypothetical protein